MATHQVQGLVKKHTLTTEEVEEIKQLAATCDTYELLHTRLLISMIQERSGDDVNDFLFYEDGILAGYLSMDSFGNKEKEVVGVVHPEHRRKGIFRLLLNALVEEGKRRGVERLILVCERTSASGQAVMQKLGATLDFSEHEMHLGTFQPRGNFDDRLIFREATIEDTEKIVSIMHEPDDSEEGIRHHIEEVFKRPGQRRIFLSLFGQEPLGCEEPVGTLRLEDMNSEVGIYGFVILPDYRGRGYGRQMLEEAIFLVHDEGQQNVMLDVETTNTNALGLYLSVGFEIKTTYDYYAIPIA